MKKIMDIALPKPMEACVKATILREMAVVIGYCSPEFLQMRHLLATISIDPEKISWRYR